VTRCRSQSMGRQFGRAIEVAGTPALAPLGDTLAMEVASGAGFRRESIPAHPKLGCGGPFVHIAFASKDRRTVDAFYRAALAAGARDNGAPGLRPEYHPRDGQFAARVLSCTGRSVQTRPARLFQQAPTL